jgi:hypothetical protein
MARMSFFEIPFVPVRAEATESRLEKIYDAARMGLKGDSLALAAGLAPKDFRKLASLDPLVEIAEAKGRADGEVEMARTIYNAAKQGDTKAALDMLKHAHGWVAKQQIDVSVDQQISITGALEKARTRVIEGFATEVAQSLSHTPDNAPQLKDAKRAATDL